ncbi:MAG: matrixin family metalloprotease [Verrucomicrobiota bacterium]
MKPLFGLLCLLTLATCLRASSSLPMTAAERLAAADASGLAKLVTSHAYLEQGVIWTRFTFRTVESLRGDFPAYFAVSSPGGVYQGEGNADSRLPRLQAGQTYLLNLDINGGKLRFADGPAGVHAPTAVDLPELRAGAAKLGTGADLTVFATEPVSVNYAVTASGLLDEDGFRRFTSPDRGEPIPVYVDVSTRPAGISEGQAITALQNALAAWEAVSTVRFSYQGTQVFAQSANTYTAEDGLVIRVQMHDTFNHLDDESSTLGVGGAGFYLNSGDGGTIADNPFNPISRGYVILNHPKTALQNVVTLEEVLTHEIGHVIGLAHSSETGGETDETLAEAIMFFQAHADGRGAQLNSHDITTVLKAHPLNTPPYGYDRVIYAVSPNAGTIANPEVNQVMIGGADLQGSPLTVQLDTQSTAVGGFSLNGAILVYSPPLNSIGPVVADPTSSSYNRAEVRLSDGTNLSPFISVIIAALLPDSQPNGAPDGLPDSWMTTHFGSANGSTATADPDGDGLTNLREFLLGTDPTDAASAFKITDHSAGTLTWTSQRFDNYTVQSSSDLATWTTERFVTQPDAAPTLTISDLPTVPAGGRLFFRVVRQD